MVKRNKKFSFGPGFIVTAAFIGPGTVTSCSLAGASFGYALLYSLVFATIMTIILQEMTGRLALASGTDFAGALRTFPEKASIKLFYIIITIAAITIGCAAYEAGNIIGGSIGIEVISGIDRGIWSLLITLAAALVLSRRSYKLIEIFLVILVFVMSLAFLITAVIVKPDIIGILKGTVPSFPRDSLYLVLALVGTTVVPYNLFLHSSAVREKWKTVSDIKAVRLDLYISIIIGGLISAAIVITSAAAFFGTGKTIESGGQLALQLKPLFGQLANISFGIGLFAAGMSSAITAPYAASLATAGVLGWDKNQRRKYLPFIWAFVILAGFVVSIFNLKPIPVIVFAQVTNGLILPIAAIFLLIVLNNKKRLGKHANSPAQNILGIITTLAATALGLWNIFKLLI